MADTEKFSEEREMLCELGMDEVKVLNPVGLDKAIIGVTPNYDHVIYSYEKLVQAYMDTEGWTEEEAIEWIDYNTLRGIPYMGSTAPIIVMNEHMFNNSCDE